MEVKVDTYSCFVVSLKKNRSILFMPDGHVVPRGFQIVTFYLNQHEKEYEISFRIIRIFSAIGS